MRELFGLERRAAGSGSSEYTTSSMFALDDGRWAHAELLYVDRPLSDVVTPPMGADLRGAIKELPIRDTGQTFTFAERPPAVLDEVFGCVRVVVNSYDFEPASELARERFLEGVESGLARWLSELLKIPVMDAPRPRRHGEYRLTRPEQIRQ